MSFARFCFLVVLMLAGVLMAVACGGEEGPSPPSPTTAPTVQGTPGPELTPTSATPGLSAVTGHCNPPVMDTTPYQLEVKAEWKGEDRIVIEGSVLLPAPASLQYVICQDGEVSFSLVPARRPEVGGGEIEAESKLVSSERPPVFDPDAKFEAVLYFMRQDIQIPMLIAKVPVEGHPE